MSSKNFNIVLSSSSKRGGRHIFHDWADDSFIIAKKMVGRDRLGVAAVRNAIFLKF